MRIQILILGFKGLKDVFIKWGWTVYRGKVTQEPKKPHPSLWMGWEESTETLPPLSSFPIITTITIHWLSDRESIIALFTG